MKVSDFRKLSAEGLIGEVVLTFYPEKESWHVWAYDHEGSSIVARFGNRLVADRGGYRAYTSIDRAYAGMRSLGYTGRVIVEACSIGSASVAA